MSFITDKQTFYDLDIPEARQGEMSVYAIFNKVQTYGGKMQLTEFFLHPLSDLTKITARRNLIEYIHRTNTHFPFDRSTFDFIEHYLRQPNKPVQPASALHMLKTGIKQRISPTNEFYLIQRGTAYVAELLRMVHTWAVQVRADTLPDLLKEFIKDIDEMAGDKEYRSVMSLINKKALSLFDIGKCDHIFRYKGYERLKRVLTFLYQMDVFIAAARTITEQAFTLPDYTSGPGKNIYISEGFHPLLEHPVRYDIRLDPEKNICFLTGANMSGKSTFIKSFGIIVFLAHLGFPVPARSVTMSGFDGMMTTINLSDNIQKGYSHFFSEVARLKETSGHLARNQHMVIILDEPFKGTNVKDAQDATIELLSAFAKIRESIFIVSTHLTEAAKELEKIRSIDFRFFPMSLENGIPTFNYRMQPGITDDRLGLYILKKEGVIDMLNKCAR